MDPLLLQDKMGEFSGNVKDHKLVPWMSWDEWDSVRISLFSNLPESISSALSRIRTWRSRGCLPIVIEVTASIIEIQQKDPSIRLDLSSSVSDSEEVLAMLYSMAVMRLVNGLVEKTRRRTKVSIAEAAAAINMPRMLIDIRHEASHRDLPSLPLLRQAATEALDWLKSYYWDPQQKTIPFKHGESANIKEEIRSRLQELSFGLKTKQKSRPSSQVKRKRSSKKHITRVLKTLVRLYSFFSLEFVSVLLENLLGMRNSVDIMEFQDKFRFGLSIDDMQAAIEKWEPVISNLSEMEPELLLNLLESVLDMIDARTSLKEDIGLENLGPSPYDSENLQLELLSSLLCRLLEILRQLKPVQTDDEPGIKTVTSSVLPKPILLELVRRCLLISEPGNETLFNSALALAHMIGDTLITERLKKLSVVFSSSSPADMTVDDTYCDVNLENSILLHDKDIQKATRNLDVLKSKLAKGGNDGKSSQSPSSDAVSTGRWCIAESWNPCPIGMLPRCLGQSGRLPVLECGHKLGESSNSIYKDTEKDTSTSMDVRQHGAKRSASSDLEELDISCAKRVREKTDDACDDKADTNNDIGDVENLNNVCTGDDNVIGHLMINGVMQKVSEEEVKRIQSGLLNLFRKPCLV